MALNPNERLDTDERVLDFWSSVATPWDCKLENLKFQTTLIFCLDAMIPWPLELCFFTVFTCSIRSMIFPDTYVNKLFDCKVN